MDIVGLRKLLTWNWPGIRAGFGCYSSGFNVCSYGSEHSNFPASNRKVAVPNDFQNTTKEFQKISLSILETLLLIICRNKLATNNSGSFHSAQRSLVIAGAAK